MAQLPLKTRRMRARGFNSRLAGLIGSRTFRGIGNRATLTTSLAGANNDITLLSERPGTIGNSVTLTLVAPGTNNAVLSVSVAGNAITVNLATNGAAAVTTTANDLVRAINFNSQVIVWAQLAPANDGTGVVTALGATALSGGVAFSS